MKDWLEIMGRAFAPYGMWCGMPTIHRVPPEQILPRRLVESTGGQDR